MLFLTLSVSFLFHFLRFLLVLYQYLTAVRQAEGLSAQAQGILQVLPSAAVHRSAGLFSCFPAPPDLQGLSFSEFFPFFPFYPVSFQLLKDILVHIRYFHKQSNEETVHNFEKPYLQDGFQEDSQLFFPLTEIFLLMWGL